MSAFRARDGGPPALGAMDRLVEQRIAEAMARGEFERLSGAGKPLRLDDDALVPEALRAAYRMLRNAGYLPPELLLTHEIREAEDLLRALDAPRERVSVLHRLALLRARLGDGRARALDTVRYRDRLHQVLSD